MQLTAGTGSARSDGNGSSSWRGLSFRALCELPSPDGAAFCGHCDSAPGLDLRGLVAIIVSTSGSWAAVPAPLSAPFPCQGLQKEMQALESEGAQSKAKASRVLCTALIPDQPGVLGTADQNPKASRIWGKHSGGNSLEWPQDKALWLVYLLLSPNSPSKHFTGRACPQLKGNLSENDNISREEQGAVCFRSLSSKLRSPLGAHFYCCCHYCHAQP